MDHTAKPNLSDKGKAEAAERQRRQAEQLRANLARRKAQSRARQDCQEDGSGEGGGEGGGDGPPRDDRA